MKIKSQSSLEFLIIVMLGIVFLIPITNYIAIYQITYRDTYKINAAKDVTETLSQAADNIFLQGYPAGITLNINMPAGIYDSSISERTIQLKVQISSGVTDVFSFSKEDVKGSLPKSQGLHKILIKNEKTFVSINEVG